MPAYLPLHDKPPLYCNPDPSFAHLAPRYGPPDLDISLPLFPPKMSDSEESYGSDGENGYEEQAHEQEQYQKQHGQAVAESSNGHSRKRQRVEHEDQAPPPAFNVRGVMPQFFGIAPRNEFTKAIGEFILSLARGRENVEVEIKLGTLMSAPGPADPVPRRMRMPTVTEMIIPPDYPIGSFSSNMTKHQNMSLNQLLNQATEQSLQLPHPIKFFRARQIDEFYSHAGSMRGGGKIRVSRDRDGNVIPGGVITKRSHGHMNVYSPRSALDWRVSVSTEDPAEMPQGPPTAGSREKDRACYRHELCQVDLTVVTQRFDNAPPTVSHEVEIELLDVPSFLAAAEHDPDRFDAMLQSVLDTARMIIRNVAG